MDELSCLATTKQLDIISITESWFSSETPDNAYQLLDFVLFRRDRPDRIGGGVVCYIRPSFHPQAVFPMSCHSEHSKQFELLWISSRPRILPFSIIIIAVVYCSPWYDSNTKKLLADHIIACIDILNKRYICPAYFIMGDFNSLATDFFILGLD